jgi:hypothetical protein
LRLKNKNTTRPGKSAVRLPLYLALLWVIGSTACMLPIPKPEPEVLPNEVNLAPILELETPAQFEEDIEQVIDVEYLAASPAVTLEPPPLNTKSELEYLYWAEHQNKSTTVSVDIQIYADVEKAKKRFKERCTLFDDPLYATGSGRNQGGVYQYCIPYLEQQQGGPESFYALYDSYSYIGLNIQKGNMLILIDEQTRTPDRTVTNAAIEQLAEAMRRKLP